MKILLRYFIKAHWKKIVPLMFFQFIASFSQFYGIYIVGKLMNFALKGSDHEFLGYYEIVMIVATIATILAMLAVYAIAVDVSSSAAYNIRKRMFHIYANAPIGEINKLRSTSLISHATREVYNIRKFIFDVLGYLSLIPLVFLVLYLDISYMSSFLGYVYLILIAIIVVFVYIILKYACNKYFSLKVTFAPINYLFKQGALLIDNVRVNNKEEYEKKSF